MLRELIARASQGLKTSRYPDVAPTLPDRFRGRPEFTTTACPPSCGECSKACPTGALRAENGAPRIDLGACLFCATCVEACPAEHIRFTSDHRLAAARREDLIVNPGEGDRLATALHATAQRLFGRSLRLRQVSAGGCNACEADVNVLGTIAFDIGRFGIEFVASPRHADGLLITGPVPENMALALRKTWDATPGPKVVIAVGACAISGGPYAGHPQVHDGATDLLPVDLYIPGCPPHPFTILDGLLRMLGRIPDPARAPTST